MSSNSATIRLHSPQKRPSWIAWLPLSVLPVAAVAARNFVSAWAFMWILAFSIYAGFKWQSWWQARRGRHQAAWRSLAYLLLWPGMDAESFLVTNRCVSPPPLRAWTWAVLKTALGATLLWAVARRLPPGLPLLRGWTGMLGSVLMLHFGSFEIS